MNEPSVWSLCRSCKSETNHIVLAKHSIGSSPDDYNTETKHMMLSCMGCTTISFRIEYHDYESMTQTGPDEWEHDITVDIFPHTISGHSELDGIWETPEIVRNIYRESILAIQEKAYTLAGLGLRATVEAVCNSEKIRGKDLCVRINSMRKSGLISQKDADRLHSIRFMGNDAAHEIISAEKESVLVALKIVEHLLLSLYVFEKRAVQLLELPVSHYADIKKILKQHLGDFVSGNVFSLQKWLGKDKRRIVDNFQTVEATLYQDVERGGFPEVIFGPMIPGNDNKQYQGYKKV